MLRPPADEVNDSEAERPTKQRRMKEATILSILLAVCVCAYTAAADNLSTDLLFHANAEDEKSPVRTVKDWEQQRSRILIEAQRVMGALPGPEKRAPLQVLVTEEVDCGSYVRQKIIYRSESNNVVPAYLLVPKAAQKKGARLIAVLSLHPTDNIQGNKVVVGLTEKPNRNYAEELAERGFVTIAPAYPRLADYQPDWKALGYESGTMKAIWDNIRALDLLDSLPFVDHRGYGVIGHSLGGHNAVFTAVFDERLKVIVSSCGLDSFQDYKDGDITGWTSDKYMPKLLEYPLAEIPFDFDELIAALAPRTCFISAPLHDTNFKWRSVARIGKAASPIYALYDAKDHLQIQHPDSGHDFPEPIREHAYSLFDDMNSSQ